MLTVQNIMVICCICKLVEATSKITDGNPKYRGKPICPECAGYRKLLKEGQRLGLEQAKLEQEKADLVEGLEDKLEKLTIIVAKPTK